MEEGRDFYVALMSNNSMENYPDNVLSAFTNKLPRPIRLEGNWVVGLTHISYGPFSAFQRMQMPPEPETSPNFDVEVFEPIIVNNNDYKPPPPKKHKRVRIRRQEANVEKKVVIKVSDTHNIILSQTDLKELTYEKNHLNCGKLLRVLSEKIVPRMNENDPQSVYEMEMLRRKIKHQIMDLIDKEDWITGKKVVKSGIKKDEFMLHVYQGSSKSVNIPIQYLEHDSIESFIREIVNRLPLRKRETNSLRNLFNIFHNSYDLRNENTSQTPVKTKEMNLYIPLAEYGTSSGLNTKDLLKKYPRLMEEGISLDEIIALFRENLQYKDEKSLSTAEKLELRMKIKNAIIDVLRGNALNASYSPKQYKKDDLPLNVPYLRIGDNSYDYYRAVLEAKTYDHEDQFLNEIYSQIPLDKRNKVVFLETLNQAFVKSIYAKRSMPNELEDLSQPLQSKAYDYADPTNLKAESKEFPVRPAAIQAEKKNKVLQEPTPETPTVAVAATPAVTEASTPKQQPVPAVTEAPEQKTHSVIPGPVQIFFNKARDYSRQKEIVAARRNVHKNRFIFVYSDVICGRIIGESITKFLRIIPLTDNTRDTQFQHVEYIRVEKNYLDAIEILLTNSYGEKIAFEASTVPTYLMLHFKRQ